MLWLSFIPIAPRLFLIFFRYCQPAIVSEVIRYIKNPSGQDSQRGHAIVFVSAIVYIGLVVSKVEYQRSIDQLRIATKGVIVGLVNNKSLSQPSNAYEYGRAVSLLSTDSDGIVQSARIFHETWAQIIEVTIGMVMLARLVGWVCPVPLVVIFCCSQTSRYLAKNLQARQEAWNMGTQQRLATTTSMLSSLKSVKMLGLSDYIESLVSSLRKDELYMAERIRRMMVAHNASANASVIFSPILTIIIYALVSRWRGSTLDVETAFTATALLGLVTHSASMIMAMVPQASGSLAAFERVRQYLSQPDKLDQRSVSNGPNSPDITLENVSVLPSPSVSPILSGVSLTVTKGSIIVCSGPEGSGKSCLAKAILGEAPISNGAIAVSTRRIGYCQQSPWLPNQTLKQAICGFYSEDTLGYREVVRLCCLDQDILSLPDADETMIGSGGSNLSGGQRQRVALARALYSRTGIVLLDDCFSALDGTTEGRIIENLFGPSGYFKKQGITVLLFTRSASHFALSDWLVILGNGSITYQGTYDDLREKPDHAPEIDRKETSEGQGVRVDENVQIQGLTLTEATFDCDTRATGDPSLYGKGSACGDADPHCTNVGNQATLPAPSAYFSGTGAGVILNRQDIQLVDRQLPAAILSICNQTFELMVQTTLLFSAQNLLAATLPLCVAAVYFVQKIEGIATIRAFGWEEQVEQLNTYYLDRAQKPTYTLFCLQQWLGVVLDLIVAAIVIGLISLAVLSGTTAGQIGMALNIVLVANTTLSGLVTSWMNMEMSLGAISRIKTFESDTPKEEMPLEHHEPGTDWPSVGAVELVDVAVAHGPDSHALQDITMTIPAGGRLTVCDGTGSGKSTLMLTLLRLLDLQSGSIRVDGIDLSLVPRSLVRQRCFITVLQDPFILDQVSLRFNLDPSGTHPEKAIILALEKATLWSHFISDQPVPDSAKILDSPISSLPRMSSGQSQLFALARAVLRLWSLRQPTDLLPRAMPILLLEEATSSLDLIEEGAVRSIVREEFAERGHTVISITQRASGSDRGTQALDLPLG
ncbi:ABC-type multidrug transport system, ATPase and permease component [Geosmithia morbida]|uniref:ABC-type multidrug transport system, ATPase and permease component n=1 Tax=Geosmithia morbida TaxID=1094350 RepID=A0A9P4YTG6_9HYPO|nr:ABC-type multidrug transport system, ATPase and permease component [Geosmithia morbida]KAF4121361.1 ABC-type multidrug transport system, ATPase and permease component [Geosmithia morbida]